MQRKLYYWKLPSVELQLGERTLLMGILNITPDSFSDGGLFNNPDRAYARALELEEQGADILDIGAESTRPDSARIPEDEEWRRLLPVLKLLKDKLAIPISLDTYKSEIAERALQFGVQIINDPSGLTYDPALAKVAADGKTGLVLNHMRGLPESWAKLPPMPDVIGTIGRDLDATTNRARRAGVDNARIVVDPGLGFGKRKEQNSEIIGQLARLADLGYPILIGPSRKSFLNVTAGGDTPFSTAAAVTASILNGAHIVRVHDVKEMRSVLHIADEIARASVPPEKSEEQERAERPAPRKRLEYRAEEDARPRPPRPPLAARPAAPAAAAPPPPPPPPPSLKLRRPAPQGDAPPPKREWKRDDRPAGPPSRGGREGGVFRGRPKQDGPPKGPWQDRPARSPRPGSDRPARPPRPGSERPDRPARGSFGDKGKFAAPKKFGPKKEFGAKKEFGPKKEYGPKRDDGRKPPRPFRKRP